MPDGSPLRVINIVDSLRPVNFGIWNAALATVNPLQEEHSIRSWLVAPAGDWNRGTLKLEKILFDGKAGLAGLRRLMDGEGCQPGNTVIATHGSWRFPTRWGARLAREGFPWVYCPQGMLEPWSLRQKRWAKALYLPLIERRLVRKAAVIRAVSRPERDNLRKMFGPQARIEWIPNGVPRSEWQASGPSDGPCRILFLGRLHPKKCPRELAAAFVSSRLHNNPGWELVVAGPDQGEARGVAAIFQKAGSTNARLAGPVYGADKESLLRQSTYFVLPSHSEGFPTAVVEAMSMGCIPVLTPGCNFPEAVESGLADLVEPEVGSLRMGLDRLAGEDPQKRLDRQKACALYIARSLTLPVLAGQQAVLFRELAAKKRQPSADA